MATKEELKKLFGDGKKPTGDDFSELIDGVKGEKGDPGKDGVKGDPGEDGTDGAKGEPGADGKDGTDGAKGDPFTYEDFTEEQLEALRGPKGEPGEDGKDGTDAQNQFTEDEVAKIKALIEE